MITGLICFIVVICLLVAYITYQHTKLKAAEFVIFEMALAIYNHEKETGNKVEVEGMDFYITKE